MINPISVLFTSIYLHSRKRNNSLFGSKVSAYSISAMTLTFFLMFLLGLVCLVLQEARLFDSYVLVGNGTSFLIYYALSLGLIAVNCSVINDTENLIRMYSTFSWIRKYSTWLSVLPLMFSGVGLATVSLFIPS